MPDVSVTIIGGGVVGLAIAAELSPRFSPLFLLERHPQYGQETSSRNSEVIHAGMYYPTGSLKARLCVEGNSLLYELCDRHGIPHRRITKIITATTKTELPQLDTLLALGRANGVDLSMMSEAHVRKLEPSIETVGGVFSPNTGIISAHGLMDYFFHTAKSHGAEVQRRCTVIGLTRATGGYQLEIEEGGTRTSFTSEIVINAAGLDCDTVASLAGINVDEAGYRLHWCKGCYFALPASLSQCVSRLVYPVPSHDSLGVHAVLDLGGRLRFGPDVEYLKERKADYAVDPAKRSAFAASIRKILPHVRDDEIEPDMSGIRPKTQYDGGPWRDFIIVDEKERGLPGLINLIGIDSPGLTASPAIARYVAEMVG